MVYAGLLLLSHAWLMLRRGSDPLPLAAAEGVHRVDVPRLSGADQESGGAPVSIAARTLGGDVSGGDVDGDVERNAADRPLVVLLHGSPGSRGDFRIVQPILAEDFTTVAVDLPGFGESTRRVPDYAPGTHADYLARYLDERFPNRRVHLVGFSMGGAVGLQFVRQSPERVASLTMLAATGIQEGEGSGDYAFEHLTYRIGWGLVVGLPDLVPHFGLLGDRRGRRAFIRNFMDSDQRPLRGVIETMDAPVLVVHGADDFLVPPWTAREHYRLAPTAELVMSDGNHFDVFTESRGPAVAAAIADFVQRVEAGEPVGDRRADSGWAGHVGLDGSVATDDRGDGDGDGDGSGSGAGGDGGDALPVEIRVSRGMNPWVQSGIVAAATFVSEDLTCIASGLLARRGDISIPVALLGCTLGIFLGDVGLWLVGRLGGRRALKWKWLQRKLPVKKLEQVGGWIDDHAGRAIITSRFVPGTRLPLYVAAGMLGRNHLRFFAWFAVAALLWTPFIVLLVVAFGHHVVGPLERIFGESWLALAAAVVLLFMTIRVVEMSLTRQGRRRLRALVSRFWRWEFWPAWIFYVPVVPWIVWLSIRHRGFNVVTAANPGIPHGGFVGEVKSEILERMRSPYTLAGQRIDVAGVDGRMAAFESARAALQLDWPIIIKPEVGERGVGVRLASDAGEARRALAESDEPMVVQAYHAGPHEAGVFYVREPGADAGRIFSITHKVFPTVVGDGKRTLKELIWQHPRYAMQASTFLRRHESREAEVIPAGESIRLAEAGNHTQGTMFVDGMFLATPQLAARMDEIAKNFEGGFDFGRFDVRYRDEERFKAGEDFGIIELNGVTSEATSLYDPGRGLWAAYRTLYAQWAILFRIGAANRDAGVKPTGHGQLIALVWRHLRRAAPDRVGD